LGKLYFFTLHAHVPLSPSSVIWYGRRAVTLFVCEGNLQAQ